MPPALREHGLHAAWWPLIAPVLYPVLALAAFRLALPDTYEGVFGPGGGMALQWQFFTTVHLVLFWRITEWGLRIGVGPFAGPLNPDLWWLAGAIVFGPVVAHGGFLLVETLTGQTDPGWAWREDEASDLLGPRAIGLAMIGYTVLLAPLIEEIGFRGVALGFLVTRGVPAAGAVVITAFAFAVMHWQYTPLGLVPIFLDGLFFGWLRVASRGMAAPMAAHVAANASVIWLMLQAPGG